MNDAITRFEALQAAVARCPASPNANAGTQEALAELLGVSQPTVSNWLNRSKQLPAEYVLRTERFTGVSRHDLRPDIYPRDAMVDQGREDRFCGIDLNIAGRRAA